MKKNIPKIKGLIYMDYTEAQKYENGWIISSERAKTLFLAEIKIKAQEISHEWNSLSEKKVNVGSFVSFVNMQFGWMSAENLQSVGMDEINSALAEYINHQYGYFHNEEEIQKFINESDIEFWTGKLELDYPDSYMWNFGEGSQVIKQIVDGVFESLI